MNLLNRLIASLILCNGLLSAATSSGYLFNVKSLKDSITISIKDQKGSLISSCTLPLGSHNTFRIPKSTAPWKLSRLDSTHCAVFFDKDGIALSGSVNAESKDLLIIKLETSAHTTIEAPARVKLDHIQCNNLTIKAKAIESKGISCDGSCKLNAQSWTNNGVLRCKGDLMVAVPEGLFFQSEGACCEVGGNMAITSRYWHNHGCPIKAVKDIVVTTQTFTNDRLPLDSLTKRVSEDCKKIIFSETSEAASLESLKGNITITCHEGKNEASRILAPHAITINAHKFHNTVHTLENIACDKQWFEGWFNDYYTYNPRSYSHYTPAIIAAGDSVIFVIDGKSFTITRATPFKRIPGVYNTGVIQAGDTVSITSTKQSKTQLVNGSQEKSDDQPTLQSLAIKPNVHAHLSLTTSSQRHENHPLYIYSHVLDDKNTIERPRHLLGYTGLALSGNEKLVMSERLQAELIRLVIEKHTGMPFVNDYSDEHEQLVFLQELGFLYAIIRGELVKIPGNHKVSPIPPLAPEERDRLRELIKLLALSNTTLTPEQLHERLHLVRTGSHSARLSESQYEATPVSLVYYQLIPFNGQWVISARLHVAKEDKKNNYHPEGLIKARDIKVLLDRVYNFGSMIALNKLEIKANTVVNQKPVSKTHKKLVNAGHTTTYTIVTPQPGGSMLGMVVEVESDGDPKDKNSGIQNVGGTISAQHRVYLVAKGDIHNKVLIGTQVVEWEPGLLGRALGNKNAALKKTFEGGKIESPGDVVLESQAGFVINEASKIIGSKSVTIKGYLGVLLKSVTARHTYNHTTSLKGLTVESFKEEADECARSYIESEDKVKIASQAGSVIDEATVYQSKEVEKRAAKDIRDKSVKVKNKKKKITTGVSGLQVGTTTTRTEEEHSLTTEYKTQVLDVEALRHVSLPGIRMEGNILRTVAGKKLEVTPVTERSSSHTESYSLGLKFFGSEAIQLLFSGEYKNALLALTAEEPTLKALYDAIYSQTAANAIANSEILALQVYRLLSSYVEIAKSSAVQGERLKKIAFLGQRVGITDAEGKFHPSITFQFAHAEGHHEKEIQQGPHLHLEKWIASGQDGHIVVFSRSKIKEFVGAFKNSLHLGTTKTTEHTSYDKQGLSVGTNGQTVWGGPDSTHRESESVTHDATALKLDKATIIVGKNFIQEKSIEADEAVSHVGGKHTLVSHVDHATTEQEAYSASLSSAGLVSGSVAVGDTAKPNIVNPTHLTGKKRLEVTAKVLELIGAYVAGKKGAARVEAEKLIHEDITMSQHEKFFGFGLEFGEKSGIPGFFDIAYKDKHKKVIIKATVTADVDLKAGNDISKLNRDKKKIRQVIDEGGADFRIVIPILNIKKLGNLYHDLRTAGTPEEKAAIEEEIENVVEENLDEASNQEEEKTETKPQEQEQARAEPDQTQAEQQDTASGTYENTAEETINTIASFTTADEAGSQQETILVGLPAEKVVPRLEEIETLLQAQRYPEYLQYTAWSFDPHTKYFYYRFDVDRAKSIPSNANTKTYKEALLNYFGTIFKENKEYVVDFTNQLSQGLFEVYTGYDLTNPAMLPKGKSGVWGRKLGHMAGLAYAAGQFVDAFLLFTATGAEAIATPLSGGAAAIAIPATAAAAVVCTADGCRVFNNYLNQRPVEQATSNNDAGGGDGVPEIGQRPQTSPHTESKPGVIKKLDEAVLKKKHEGHIFSDKHKKEGLLNLGTSRPEIMDQFIQIIKKCDKSGLVQNGSNQIQTIINGHEVEIRFFIKNGEVLSFNGMIGWSERSVNNLIRFPL